MGHHLKINFILEKDFNVSKENIENLYEYISNFGWEYESNTTLGYFIEDDWEDETFSEALKAVSEKILEP